MKDIARLIHMVGKLSELPQGGQGLYVASNRVMLKLRMQDLAAELARHEIPHRVLSADRTIDIEVLRVKIRFMAIDDLEHRVLGLELAALVDDVTCVLRLTERQWLGLNIARSRVRERH